MAAAKAASGSQLPNNTPSAGQNTADHSTTPNSTSMADGNLFPLMNQKAAVQRRQQPPSPREVSPSGVSLLKMFLDIY